MASIHKRVKEAAIAAKTKISDSDFFVSKLLKIALEEKAAAATSRYYSKQRVRVNILYDKEIDITAFTDGNKITINAGNNLIQDGNPTRLEQYERTEGMFVHELAHVLYTNFSEHKKLSSNIKKKAEFKDATPPCKLSSELTDKWEDLLSFLSGDKEKISFFDNILNTINNIVEDGYIEERISREFPGSFAYCLNTVREVHLSQMPTIETMLNDKDDELSMLLQILLCYVKFGEILYGDINKEEVPLIKTFYSLISQIDTCLEEHNGKERIYEIFRLVLLILPMIKDFYEKQKKEGKTDSEITSGVSGMGESLKGTSTMGKGSSGIASSTKPSSSSPETKTGKKRAKTKKEAGIESSSKEKKKKKKEKPDKEKEKRKYGEDGETGEDSEAEGSETGEDGETGEDSEAEGSETGEDGEAEDSETGDGEAEGSEGSEEKTGSSDTDSSSFSGSDSGSSSASAENDEGSGTSTGEKNVGGNDGADGFSAEDEDKRGTSGIDDEDDPHDDYEFDEGTNEYDEDGEGGESREEYESSLDDDTSAKELERLMEKMAEERGVENLEKERESDLEKIANSLPYENAHRNVHVTVCRQMNVTDTLIENYKKAAPPLLKISKALQRHILQELKDIRTGGKQNGLYYGRRLDSHSLHRADGKIFSNNKLPSEAPRIAVCLLLDESGSMSWSGRQEAARASAIIIEDFCRGLDIPCMIYGHTAEYRGSREDMILFPYAEFDSYDKKDKYRIMDSHARSNNRDGMAVQYCAERLLKRDEEIKLFIIVSDGIPAASGYYGTAACEDLKAIVNKYKKQNIIFSAAAIGSDKETIETLYGDSFMDITDLTTLPIKLTKLIKKHIRF